MVQSNHDTNDTLQIDREAIQDSVDYIDAFVIRNALLLYRASLWQIPGGPETIPHFVNIDQSIVDQIEQASSKLAEIIQRYTR